MIQIYSVFYISLLLFYAIDSLSKQIQPKLQPIKMDDKQEWEIKEIYNLKRIKSSWVKYFIKQTEYNALTQEKLANLINYTN